MLNEAYLQDWIDEQQAIFKEWEAEGWYPGIEQDCAAGHSEEFQLENVLWRIKADGIAKCEAELREVCHG
jgi:hypothetical protein